MKNLLKSSLFIVALSVGAAGISYAQDPQQPAATQAPAATPAPDTSAPATRPVRTPNPNKQTKELSKRLGLTSDQTAKVEPIIADRDQRLEALNSDTTLDQKAMRKQRRAINVDADQKLNSILTPDQQTQYATMKSERRPGGAGQAGAGETPATSTPPPPVI